MPEDTPTEDFKYWAFICYSHTDEKWGQWLHRSLETYRVPKHLVGKKTRIGVIPKRVFPVFRDRDELPGSANLGEEIEAALQQSRFLIVICSPRAVVSKWVDQEVRIFKSLGREHRVLCLVVEGEPHATTRNDCHEPECLPDAVRFWVHSDRSITPIPTEPIAADARKGKDGKKNALLKLMSGLLGVEYDALRQREEERKQRQQQFILTASAALVILFSIAGVEFYFQRNEAIIAREAAVLEAKSARIAAEVADAARQAEVKAKQEARDAADKATKALDAEIEAKREAQTQTRLAQDAEQKAKDAEAAARRAQEDEAIASREAKAYARQVSQTLSLSLLASAARLSDEGDTSKALAYLSRALRYDTENVAVISRIISLLSQKNWALPVCAPLQHDAGVQNGVYSADGKFIVTRAGNSAVMWDAATGRRIYTVQHSAQIHSIEFSPDGKKFVTASQDNTAQIWMTDSGEKHGQPFKHQNNVLHASFSPDGKYLATASQDRTALVWDIATGAAVTPPLLHDEQGPVKLVRFTPNGKSVVTVATVAQRWELSTGERIGISMGHDSAVRVLAISPDGKWIATGARDARVWDAITGEAVTNPLPHGEWVNTVEFSPDSRQVLSASDDMTAKVWDIATGNSVELKHDLAVNAARFSPNGRWVATASDDGSARLWKTTGELFCEDLRHSTIVRDAQFSPDGRFLTTSCEDATAKIWSITSSRATLEPLLHDGWANVASFSPDGRLLATVSDDRTARIWDVKTAQAVSAPLQHNGRPVSVAFNSDGKLLATGSVDGPGDGSAQIWDVLTGKPLFAKPLAHESWVNGVSFSPNGALLVTASQDRHVRLWDVASGKVTLDLPQDRAVKNAVFSSDGKWIITTVEARSIKIWDATTGKAASTNFVHDNDVTSAVLSPDGKLLATGSQDKRARVWNVATGECLWDLPHDSTVKIVSFTPAIVWKQKPWLLTVSDRIARVWDVSQKKAVTEPLKKDDEIRAATFGPHGNLLATAAGKSVKVWEASTGRSVAEPLEFNKEVRSVTFSPDGNFIATTSADNSARIWLVSLHGTAPAWFADMVDAVASYKLGDYGAAELFVSEQWNKLISIEKTLAAVPSQDPFGIWGRWFMSDRMERNVSPFSSTRVAEYVRKRSQAGGDKALEEVLDLQPNNGLALVKMARSVKEPAQAELLSRLAETYEPQNTDVLWIRAQVLQGLYKFNDAFAVMQRAIALDPKHVPGFDAEGTDVSSTVWLPKGWTDASLPTVQADYLKLPNLPQAGMTGIQIAVAENRGVADLRGSRVVCRRYGKIVVEGWTRSPVKDDFSIILSQFIEPFEKYKEHVVYTTTEWKPFKVVFSPLQDIAAELRLLVNARSTGSAIQVAGIVCRVE